MNNDEIKKLTKEKLKSNWGTAIGILVVTMIINFAVSWLINMIFPNSANPDDIVYSMEMGSGQALENEASFSSYLSGIINGILVIIFEAGISWGFLEMIRTGILKFDSLVWAFKDFGKVFLTNLLAVIRIVLWGVIPMILSILSFSLLNNSLGGVFGTILAIVASVITIIKSIEFSQVNYLIREEDRGYNDYVNESKKRMEGKKGQYFWLNLSIVLPILIVTIIFIVYLIFSMVKIAPMADSLQSNDALFRLFVLTGIYFIAMLILSLYIRPRWETAKSIFYDENIRAQGLKEFSSYEDQNEDENLENTSYKELD